MRPTSAASRLRRAASCLLGAIGLCGGPLDREAIVSRHDPLLTRVDPTAPLTVGNGGFAFTVDVTGLQTLLDRYFTDGIPLETMARWGWHTNPPPSPYSLADASPPSPPGTGPLRYPTESGTPAGLWLRQNPQDFPLGVLSWTDASGDRLKETDLSGFHQRLDLWTGEIRSEFRWKGESVVVSTLVDPDSDTIAVRAESPALRDGELRLGLSFPRGHDIETKNKPPYDWSHPESHVSRVIHQSDSSVLIERRRDDLAYRVRVAWQTRASFLALQPHAYSLVPGDPTGVLTVCVGFAREAPAERMDFAQARTASAARWGRFWREGGIIDCSGSSDPRASELERRVILSLYLTAVQFGGDTPPSETGLTCSTWYGKHNTEMVWWHAAQFALWGHPEFLENTLAWYERDLPAAEAIARERGLQGARWAKMVGPQGRESPGGNPFISWNEPHPIYLAELLYRADPGAGTLDRWRHLVFEAADCLSSMLRKDPSDGSYHLGPPLWIAQEIYDPWATKDPTYELAYWRFALETAQQWRLRLGLQRNRLWDEQLAHLAPLPTRHGRYVAMSSIPDTWDNIDSRHDHPSFLMACGFLPGNGVDRPTMARTLDAVLSQWDWKTKIWGWDYPMIAMTATRLGRPADAVGILLSDKPHNRYTASGQCPQLADLPLYLPANSSLLSAVALMVAGFDGGPDEPGIPKDGSWRVKYERLRALP